MHIHRFYNNTIHAQDGAEEEKRFHYRWNHRQALCEALSSTLSHMQSTCQCKLSMLREKLALKKKTLKTLGCNTSPWASNMSGKSIPPGWASNRGGASNMGGVS